MLKNAENDEAKEEAIKEGFLTVAKNMLEKNMLIETIMEVTGLSKGQIENLK